MRFYLAAVLLGLFAVQGAEQDASPLLGFTAASSKTERDWERRFKALPEPQRIVANRVQLAGHPHNVGSAYQRKNAEWIAAKYKEWGWDAHIEQFDVLYPSPKTEKLELISPVKYTAKTTEPPLPGDPYTKDTADQLPGYNIYSGEGDVTGPLVYVNYGMQADYEELERNSISVKGAIVIARYGGGWRGLKPKLAYEHGAIGCIIYSDPADDGYVQGDVLPKGPMRPPDGIQRGSVADTTLYSGDPLTPGIASVPGAKRIPREEAKTLMHIPVLPIGYGDAAHFLSQIDGRVVPAAWRGGLPFTYHFGPGPAKAHLKLEFNWEQRPVLDVIAKMQGSEEPETWIVRGNHYDGWVNGANDPISGQSALLEEARALGEMKKQGWSPKRTLVYAAWDGEEPGLIGSTEWGEAHAEELEKHAAIYINSDETGRGFFGAGGSHSLEQVVNNVAHDVTDPETNVPVWQRQQASMILNGGRRGSRGINADALLKRKTLPLMAIGSGSDFGVFLDHLGIASLSLGFGGEDRGGTYHSAYDTPWFEEHFGDKTAAYGKTLAQTAGTLVMRFANAEILPYSFPALASTVETYDAELKALVKSLQKEAEERRRNIDLKLYKLTDDPQEPQQAPAALTAPPDLNFSAFDAAVAALKKAADEYQGKLGALTSAPLEEQKKVNAKLVQAERQLTTDSGLPGRPWVKHLLYAPGTYTGYGAKTIPGVREALEQGRYQEAEAQLAVAADALTREADYLKKLTTE